MKPSVHWRAGGYPLPSSAAARSGLGRGQRTRNRSVEQSAALRTHHHRRHLQGPLGNRAVFQSAQTKPEGEEFVGTSRNALLIQIWTALIAMLLLKWLHHLNSSMAINAVQI